MATARAGKNAVKRAATNPLLELMERLGYAVRGALYAVMGLLALGISLEAGAGQTTDLSGSLLFVSVNPFAELRRIIAAIGLPAYSLWRLVRAISDPLHRGPSACRYAARPAFA